MHYINAAADFVAPPNSLKHALARLVVFLGLAAAVIWIGHHVDAPISVGWAFGYLWGALTVYGAVRPHLKQ